jgi:hypothetical protein
MDINDPVIEVRIKTHDRAVIKALLEHVETLKKQARFSPVYIKTMTASECQDEFKENLEEAISRFQADAWSCPLVEEEA